MFMGTNRGANVFRSVVVVRCCGLVSTLPSDTPNLLGKPERKGVPAPQCDFVKDIYGYDIIESPAVLFVFKIVEMGKRLEVYKWTAKKQECRTTYRYVVFLLQITGI